MTKVLLAEDDPAISDPLARALRREGYDVDVCTDGEAALEQGLRQPDLLVLDLGLPAYAGWDVGMVPANLVPLDLVTGGGLTDEE